MPKFETAPSAPYAGEQDTVAQVLSDPELTKLAMHFSAD
jgi:hypothetical protein